MIMMVVMVVLFVLMTTVPINTVAMLHVKDISCRLPNVFSLKWRHSVERQYWQEVYQLHYPNIALNKTYLQTFGAGTPSLGSTVDAPDGYVGQAVHLTLKELNWLVSANMQGEIILGDGIDDAQTWAVYQLIEQPSEVRILPQKLTFWQNQSIPTCQSLITSP
ncbi:MULTISPECIES: DUF1850 domain-containing protein [unclassified Moraxella]|uniref:DUF1850 domain-containing protein n=1 Tax=unclassified Moraxella TaxID=2685852 RepID=UPI00359EB73B